MANSEWLFGKPLIDRGDLGLKYEGAGLGWSNVPIFLIPRRLPAPHTDVDSFLLDVGAPAESGSNVGEIGRLFFNIETAAYFVTRMWPYLSGDQRKDIASGRAFEELAAGRRPW